MVDKYFYPIPGTSSTCAIPPDGIRPGTSYAVPLPIMNFRINTLSHWNSLWKIMNELTFLSYCLISISMSFLRVRLFGTYEDLGMRRHPRGRTRPRTQTECPAFTGARYRGTRDLAGAGGNKLEARLAPARRIAAGARGPRLRSWHRHAA